jgi:ubiquinone/menaquinone biosynthesis C-methylase UbiE
VQKLELLRKFFENLAQEWDSFQPLNRDETIGDLLALIDQYILQPESILDIGTGTGAIIPILRSRYPDTRVYSIDLATEMLFRARQRVPTANLTQADVHSLPFGDQVFSAVICHNSFPHFSQKETALREIYRSLKDDGILAILHDQSRERVNEFHQNAQSPVIQGDILPPTEILCEILKTTGFIPIHIEDNDDRFLVVAGKTEYNSKLPVL